jgi:hypothetical protein
VRYGVARVVHVAHHRRYNVIVYQHQQGANMPNDKKPPNPPGNPFPSPGVKPQKQRELEGTPPPKQQPTKR